MTSQKHADSLKRPLHGLPAFAVVFVALSILICFSLPAAAGEQSIAATSKTKAANPKQSGWIKLFDGKTFSGWRGFRSQELPPCWKIEEGAFHRIVSKQTMNKECGDLVTAHQYDNFELELDWKISPGGNSGIKYLITEERPTSWEQVYLDMERQQLMLNPERNKEGLTRLNLEMWMHFPIGFEFQLIDDKGNADARSKRTHLTGALYDMLAPVLSSSRPVGEFNQARIKVLGKHVEHWINGVKVLEFERDSPQLKNAIAQSKFKTMAGFGANSRGHITLQDHESEVWFKSIRLRELSTK